MLGKASKLADKLDIQADIQLASEHKVTNDE